MDRWGPFLRGFEGGVRGVSVDDSVVAAPADSGRGARFEFFSRGRFMTMFPFPSVGVSRTYNGNSIVKGAATGCWQFLGQR